MIDLIVFFCPTDQIEGLIKEWIALVIERDRILHEEVDQVCMCMCEVVVCVCVCVCVCVVCVPACVVCVCVCVHVL